jgi:hypothetical protein
MAIITSSGKRLLHHFGIPTARRQDDYTLFRLDHF